ncbi:hypothetical protein EDB83DRAFT_2321312 [Lactarius deliciosus]|nr:hypothetical protein EDB83DRAFT_2321312 [Lactarius deliciosus]
MSRYHGAPSKPRPESKEKRRHSRRSRKKAKGKGTNALTVSQAVPAHPEALIEPEVPALPRRSEVTPSRTQPEVIDLTEKTNLSEEIRGLYDPLGPKSLIFGLGPASRGLPAISVASPSHLAIYPRLLLPIPSLSLLRSLFALASTRAPIVRHISLSLLGSLVSSRPPFVPYPLSRSRSSPRVVVRPPYATSLLSPISTLLARS